MLEKIRRRLVGLPFEVAPNDRLSKAWYTHHMVWAP